MGCDIHLHVEVKIKGRWLHYNHPQISRNYNLFCMMAGVRKYGEDGEPKPISEPRGLPDDLSDTTRFDFDWDEPDAHSMSWLSAEEAGKVQKWHDDNRKVKDSLTPVFGYVFGNYVDSHLEYPEDCKELKERGFEDTRVVFWFDN